MTKKKTLRIVAAVSAALLLGGTLVYFKDDIAQDIADDNLEPFRPIMVSQGTLDDITDDLMTETTTTSEIATVSNTETATASLETAEPVQAEDTLPEDVMQSLIDSAVSLHDTYPDSIGWLYIPDTAISYPVMQSSDNDFYLTHAYDGSRLQAGSVFLDFRCENRFMNPINILYAHNMKNDKHFIQLNALPVHDLQGFSGSFSGCVLTQFYPLVKGVRCNFECINTICLDFSNTVCVVVIYYQRVDYGYKYIRIMECICNRLIVCTSVLHYNLRFTRQ